MNLGIYSTFSTTQSQTRDGFSSRWDRSEPYLGGIPTTSRHGRRNYFSSRGITWNSPMDYLWSLECQGFLGHGTPQVSPRLLCHFFTLPSVAPCLWQTVVLPEADQKRLSDILDSLEEGDFFIIKEVLESKYFYRCFQSTIDSMASNDGDNGRDT